MKQKTFLSFFLVTSSNNSYFLNSKLILFLLIKRYLREKKSDAWTNYLVLNNLENVVLSFAAAKNMCTGDELIITSKKKNSRERQIIWRYRKLTLQAVLPICISWVRKIFQKKKVVGPDEEND